VTAIEVRDLFKVFGPGNRTDEAIERARNGETLPEIAEATGCTIAVNNASFKIDGPQIFVIMGLSGSGKSTLLRCVNYLLEPTAGTVEIDGQNLSELDKKAIRELRKQKMAMVFQHFGLLDHRDVLGNVGFGLELRGVPESERAEKAEEVLDLVGLAEHAHTRIDELSGGMQQRVGLARALATDADVLLMDEAFSALDPLIRTEMQSEFLDLQAKIPKVVLFITHDLGEALRLGDRVAIVKEGEIVQIDRPEDIVRNPQTDYVEAFVENVDRSRVLTAGTTATAADDLAVAPDLAVDEALEAMDDAGASFLYLVEDDRIGGVVHRQELERVRSEGEGTLRKIAADAPEPLKAADHLLDAIPRLARHAVPLPVVDDQGRFVGLLSKTRTLEAIARMQSDDRHSAR
jgi:glycine betaine/proline transport system ATP-binding protein